MEKTLILIKPDALQRGITGQIISRFEQKGLKIVGFKMLKLRDSVLREHYAHVVDQPFFDELSKFMSSSPVLAVCWEGLNAVEVVRNSAGTNPMQLGTIRGDFSSSNQRNLVHTSDSVDAAAREIERFFTNDEIFDYDKDEWRHIYAESDKVN